MGLLQIAKLAAERDAQGYWTHPALRVAALDTPPELTLWLRAHGLEAWIMLMYEEDPELHETSSAGETPDASRWEPVPPPGDGWFIGSIHDSGCGPVCLWLRDAPQTC